MKTIFFVIICLYSLTAVFIMTEGSKDHLRNDAKWISELSTPVCTDKQLKSPETCDIPINRMNLSTEEVIRINELSTMNDWNLLFDKRCSYRQSSGPWEWCDYPPKNHTPAHKILVLGNSYATNQGPIIYETCASPSVEKMQVHWKRSDHQIAIIQSQVIGCEVLLVSKKFISYQHCLQSSKAFHEAVTEYKPDVLFILSRHVELMDMSTTSSDEITDLLMDHAAAVLRDFSLLVTDRIFILNAMPRQTLTFEADHNAAMRAGKVLEQTTFLNQTLNLARTREVLERAVASCTKCKMIDYGDVFTVNGTFTTFDDRTQLSYTTAGFHLTPYGLHRLRPFFKKICDGISYSKPIS